MQNHGEFMDMQFNDDAGGFDLNMDDQPVCLRYCSSSLSRARAHASIFKRHQGVLEFGNDIEVARDADVEGFAPLSRRESVRTSLPWANTPASTGSGVFPQAQSAVEDECKHARACMTHDNIYSRSPGYAVGIR